MAPVLLAVEWLLVRQSTVVVYRAALDSAYTTKDNSLPQLQPHLIRLQQAYVHFMSGTFSISRSMALADNNCAYV